MLDVGTHAALCGEDHVGMAEGFDSLGRGVTQGQCKGSQRCQGLLPLLALACFGKNKKRSIRSGNGW